jgi:hypothetical protein
MKLFWAAPNCACSEGNDLILGHCTMCPVRICQEAQ